MPTTFDNHKNFAGTVVVTPPTPAASGTTLIVFDGTVFPAAPFNISIWPSNATPTPTNAEVARVTAISSNTLTITRAQESSVARAITTGDNVANTVTKKALADLEGVVAPLNTLASGGVLSATALGVPVTSAALTANGFVLGGGAGAVPTSTAALTTGQILVGVTSSPPVPTAATSIGAVQLLKSGSGTDATATATNVDTIAITGLTAADTLKVITHIESVTATTGICMLYNVTDSTQAAYLAGNGVIATAAGDWIEESTFGPKQNDTKKITTVTIGGSAANGSAQISGQFSYTTDWTGNWTLALRHGGVAATGSFRWRWAVYKVAGQ